MSTEQHHARHHWPAQLALLCVASSGVLLTTTVLVMFRLLIVLAAAQAVGAVRLRSLPTKDDEGCQCNLAPVCDTGSCESHAEADAACAVASQPPEYSVAYVSRMPKRCKGSDFKWCCKTLSKEVAQQYRTSYGANRNNLESWILDVSARVNGEWESLDAQRHVAFDSRELAYRGQEDTGAAVIRVVLSELHGHVTRFNAALEDCAMNGKDNIVTGCAAQYQYADIVGPYAETLLGLMEFTRGTLNTMEMGRSLRGRMDTVKATFEALVTWQFGRALRVVTPAVKRALVVVWRHRLTIIVGFSIFCYASPLSAVVAKSITFATEAEGYGVAITALVRQSLWGVLCPSMFDPLVSAALMHWAVYQLAHSTGFVALISSFVSDAAGLATDVGDWICAALRDVGWERLEERIGIWANSSPLAHIASVVMKIVGVVVSHIFTLLARGMCLATGKLNLLEPGTLAKTFGTWFAASASSLNVASSMTDHVLGMSQQMSTTSALLQNLAASPTVQWMAEKGAVHFVRPFLNELGGLVRWGAGTGSIAVVAGWLDGQLHSYWKGREKVSDLASLQQLLEEEYDASNDEEGEPATAGAPRDLFNVKPLADLAVRTRTAESALSSVALERIPQPSKTTLDRFNPAILNA